jgi:3-deoxy-D-manno-octulosonic-acid transferase
MRRSLSLGTYLAFRRGTPGGTASSAPARPEGQLIWVHCADPERVSAVSALAERLAAEGERLHLLVTAPGAVSGPSPGPWVILQPVPGDTTLAAKAFLDHWAPEVMLWMRGRFLPALLTEATSRSGLGARILVEAEASLIQAEGGSWMPGLTRALAMRFDRALTLDDAARLVLQRQGMDPQQIEVTGALDSLSGVLPCNERERRDLAQTLGSRPVWLAAGVDLAELPDVISAHRLASRSAHRLLLILVPRLTEEGRAIADALREAGLRTAQRVDGAEPDGASDVYVAESMSEMGLWYRLSPIAFMGGTLAGEAEGRHPFEPASLGSAVLHGPSTDPHTAAYLRLARAGASRSVRSGADLGRAVEALLAPDKAAAMAHAAWDVTTAGAHAGNRVIELIRDGLDRADSRVSP